MKLYPTKIERTDTPFGEAYVGSFSLPFVRCTATQKNYLDDGLQFWMKGTDPAKIAEVEAETSDKGVILHHYFHGVVTGQEVDVLEEWAKKPVENFRAFMEKEELRPIHAEATVVSMGLGIGGQVDFVGHCKKSSEVWLLDWKTGGIYPSYAAQLAIYMALLRDGFGYYIKNLGVVQIHRDGEKQSFTRVADPVGALRAGLLVYERWKWERREVLRWALAPTEVIEERKKLRGKKRLAFEKARWSPAFEWPWLREDSLKWWDWHFKGEGDGMGTSEEGG